MPTEDLKSEQLQKWALIAEIIGGVAIVATLVMLIFETRENTKVMQAATYDAISADIASWRMTIATDNEIQELNFVTNTEGRSSLTPRQRNLDREINVAIFQHYERAFIQWKLGNLDDEAWDRFRGFVCDVSGIPGFEESTGSLVDRVTTVSFTDFRKMECSE